jgi:hypothetical protein
MLLGPFSRKVGETGNTHAMRESTVNCRFDEIRREKRERDRHVDLAGTTPLAFRNFFRSHRRVVREFVEPMASASN